MSCNGGASYRFWSHNAKEKLALEASAAKYWSTRKPPKAVVEKRSADIASKTLKRARTAVGTFSGTNIMTIGTELTKGKKYLVNGAATAVDAAALVNSGSKDVPECCQSDGLAVVLSNRTKVYYAMYTPGTREAAIKTFGIENPHFKVQRIDSKRAKVQRIDSKRAKVGGA